MSSTTRTYRAHSLQNASGPELVVACFREARTQLVCARRHLEEGTTASSYGPLESVRKIYTHLYSTLDLEAGGELALRMQALYTFVIQTTLEVATTYDLSSLALLEQINADMLGAWSQIAQKPARPIHPAQATLGPFQASA
jgi:flagellar protein FliS